MNKQDKQLEKQLIKKLTVNCEHFKESIQGFMWLTHTVNYAKLNQSIKIICVFYSHENIQVAEQNGDLSTIKQDIIHTLKSLSITPKKTEQHIVFDSEERFNTYH